MYIMPTMIDLGLLDGQSWPTDAHRVVASAVGLCNSRVTSRDTLQAVVQAVLRIPKCKIEEVTVSDLANRYSVPFINFS